LFKIIGEESVASGTRRITALTGQVALELVRQEEEILSQAAAILRVPQNQLGDRVAALVEEIKTLKRQASQRKADPGGKISIDELISGAEKLGDATVVVRAIENQTPDELRVLIDGLRRKVERGLAVLLITAVVVAEAGPISPRLAARRRKKSPMPWSSP
jgi:alanyl-tRNA synthetase